MNQMLHFTQFIHVSPAADGHRADLGVAKIPTFSLGSVL